MTTPANKKITQDQINAAAANLGVEPAALQAVMHVECENDGFFDDGKPVILFEKHVFYRLLTQKGLIALRNAIMAQRPDLCFPHWQAGTYGSMDFQHTRLTVAASYDRDSALAACSWGLGQVMGENWQQLGYPSLQSFVNAMYRDEAGQLDAMCRFIRVNGLVDKLTRHDWAGFAYRYNGAGYKANQYDNKLAAAYASFRP